MNIARSITLVMLIVLAVPFAASAQTPAISSAGSGCDNWDCMWITGTGFLSTSKVWIANPDPDWTGQWFYGPALSTSPAFNLSSDGSTISFQITDVTLRTNFGHAGIWAVVVNPGDVQSNWSFVQSPPPVITAAGAGCPDSTCIWMTGWFPLNAYVDLRPHAQSNILSNSYSGIGVALNLVTMQVTPSAQTVWDAGGLDGAVVNGLLSNWSSGTVIAAVDRPVIGNIDAIVSSNSQYYLQGWACAQTYVGSIDVHLYAGGPNGTGAFVTATTASLSSETAIAASCNSTGTAYRFSILLTPSIIDQFGGQTIYVHGIYANPEHALIGNSGNLTITNGATMALSWKQDTIRGGGGIIAIARPAPANANAPTAPGSLTAPSPTSSSVTLNWSASTAGSGAALAGYKIYRQKSGGPNLPIASAAAAATSYTDYTVQSGQSYTYQVVAINAMGVVSTSNPTVFATTP